MYVAKCGAKFEDGLNRLRRSRHMGQNVFQRSVFKGFKIKLLMKRFYCRELFLLFSETIRARTLGKNQTCRELCANIKKFWFLYEVS